MRFLVNAITDDDGGVNITEEAMDRYMRYLDSIKGRIPSPLYEYATASWHYDNSDPRAPHDSWLRQLSIKEVTQGDNENVRKTEIEMSLLGSKQDRSLSYRYEKVVSHSVFCSNCEKGYGDFLLDEVRLSDRNLIEHEMIFSRANIVIECGDMVYEERLLPKGQ